MNSKWLYMIIGVLLGTIVAIVLIIMPGRANLQAQQAANISFGSAADIIALVTTDPINQRSILWVLNAKKKNLLIYDYDGNQIKLASVRDIQFDLNVPKGLYLPGRGRMRAFAPFDIETEFEKWRKEVEKRDKEIERRKKRGR